MDIIKVENLKKDFVYYQKERGMIGTVRNMFHREKLIKSAVNDVSFSIEKGEIRGLLGPNGAGKTTTLKILAGILYPTSGNVSVDGYIPWERKNQFKRRFAIVMGQKNQLWWDLPASDSFYLNKCIYDVDDKEYDRTLSQLTELLDVREQLKVQVRRLSLGERMKMEIIASLIHKPDILFLDEPTIGLDILSQRKIREFLKYYKQTKTTVILTSHYMQDIEELCKEVVIINTGKVVFDGALSDVNQVIGNKKLISIKLSAKVLEEELSAYGTIREHSDYEAVLETERERVNECASYLLRELPVVDFNVTDVPIEEGIALFYEKKAAKGDQS